MGKKKWLLVMAAVTAFTVGYGAVASAWPTPYHYGYFRNQFDDFGLEVWPPTGGPGPNTCNGLFGCVKNVFTSTSVGANGCAGDGNALPGWLDTAPEFTDFLLCKLWFGSTQEHIGAAFIIGTIIGNNNLSFIESDFFGGYGEFVTRFNYAASRGWINFWADPGCVLPNTYYQDGPQDVGAYGGCGSGGSTAIVISNGSFTYVIKRHCSNPLGSLPPLPKPPADFNLTPGVTAQIKNGGTVVSGNIAEPGNTVTFTYSIRNSGAADSPAVKCTYRQATYTGHSTTAPTTTFTPAGASCPPDKVIPGTTSGGNTVTVATETVSGLADNTSVCRSLTTTPTSNTNSGESAPAVACIFVAAKPYAKVYGGDIAAGAGVVTNLGTCPTNSGAAVIGWNKGNSPNYDGAGVQYAAYALNTILGVATSAGNSSGAAATPTGLSFANTSTNPATGVFGGSFGSVPCIPNYYGELPATYNPINVATTSAALPNGTSFRNGDLQVTGGTISAGKRVTLFVKGNVYISAPILYGGSGSWTTSTIPLFQLIVRGNIYIAPGVTQLDGLYVAQSANGTSDGVIYTCATGLAAPVALTSLATSCGTALTVNGGFVARQVQLMRSAGSLGNGAPAETFNYNPALWLAQPSGLLVAPAQYDSITSLPPVL